MKKFRSFSRDVSALIDVWFLQYEPGYSSFGENISIQTLHVRWISLRSEKTLHELTRILLFVQDTYLLWQENSYICNKMDGLISWLRRSQKNHTYVKVLSIVTKYLDGIKRFLAKNTMEGLLAYRQLFEWVFIAIMRETHFIELEMN